jgi:peptide/nickel transport system permease protein
MEGMSSKTLGLMRSGNSSVSVWTRFKHRKSAFSSLLLIAFITLLAFLANFLVYDHTPGADLQHMSLSLKAPGFTTSMIRIEKSAARPSLWTQFWEGYDKAYEEIPYKSILSEGDSSIVIENHFGLIQEVEKSLSLSMGHSVTYYLGTDRYGRSISSRILRGIRLSIVVGGIAVLISLSIGIILGMLAGYFQGWVDSVIMYMINVTWSIPTLLLVFAIVLAFGRGVGVIFIAVGLTMWVDVARIVRGQVFQQREEQYVTAAKSLGISSWIIMFKHILPNIIGPILVIAAANFATAILIEAGLSYLGFGINPPAPSIGNMLNDHYGYAVSGKLFLAIIPAVVIMVLVLSFNLIGAGLRDAFDVKTD